MCDVETLLYSVVYTLNEKRVPLKVRSAGETAWIYFMILFDCASIVELTRSQIKTDSPNILTPLVVVLETQDPTLFILEYTMVVIITLYVALTAIYMGISFKMSYFFSYLPAHILRATMGTVVTALYVSLVKTLIRPFVCIVNHDMTDLCVSAPYLSVISSIVLVLFVPLATATQVIYIDNHPRSTHLKACHTGRMNMLDTVVRTISTLLIGLVGTKYPTVTFGLVAFMMYTLAVNMAYRLPYFNMQMNYLRCILYFMNAHFSLSAIVYNVQIEDPDAALRAMNVVLYFLPLSIFIGGLFPYLRKRNLLKYLPRILEEGRKLHHDVAAENRSALVAIGTYPLESAAAINLFPDSEHDILLLAHFALQSQKLDPKLRQFLPADCVRYAETVYEAGLLAFPESALIRVRYANFINVVHKDHSRSTGLLLSASNLNPNFEDKYWVYAFERMWAHKRIGAAVGSNYVTALSVAEFKQHMRLTFNLHDKTFEEIRNLWVILAGSEELDLTALSTCIQQISSNYCEAFEAYEILLSKAMHHGRGETVIPLLHRYSNFIKEATFDVFSYKSLIKYIENVKDANGAQSVAIEGTIESDTKSSTSSMEEDFIFNAQKNSTLKLRRMKLTKSYVYKNSNIVSRSRTRFLLFTELAVFGVACGIGIIWYEISLWLSTVNRTYVSSQLPPLLKQLLGDTRDLVLAESDSTANITTIAQYRLDASATSNLIFQNVQQIVTVTQDNSMPSNFLSDFMRPTLTVSTLLPTVPGKQIFRESSTVSLYSALLNYIDRSVRLSSIDSPYLGGVEMDFIIKNHDVILQSSLTSVSLHDEWTTHNIQMSGAIHYGIAIFTGLVLLIGWCYLFRPVILQIHKIETNLYRLAKSVPKSSAKQMLNFYAKLVRQQKERRKKEEFDHNISSENEGEEEVSLHYASDATGQKGSKGRHSSVMYPSHFISATRSPTANLQIVKSVDSGISGTVDSSHSDGSEQQKQENVKETSKNHRKKLSWFLAKNSWLMLLTLASLFLLNLVVIIITYEYPSNLIAPIGYLRTAQLDIVICIRELVIGDFEFATETILLARLKQGIIDYNSILTILLYGGSTVFWDINIAVTGGIINLNPTITNLLVGPQPELIPYNPDLVGLTPTGIVGMSLSFIETAEAFVSRCSASTLIGVNITTLPTTSQKCSLNGTYTALHEDKDFAFLYALSTADGLLFSSLKLLQETTMKYTSTQVDNVNEHTIILFLCVMLLVAIGRKFTFKLFGRFTEESRSCAYFAALMPPEITECCKDIKESIGLEEVENGDSSDNY